MRYRLLVTDLDAHREVCTDIERGIYVNKLESTNVFDLLSQRPIRER